MAIKRLSAVAVGEEYRFTYWLDTSKTIKTPAGREPDPEFVRTYSYSRHYGGTSGAPKTPADAKLAAREAHLAAEADAARLLPPVTVLREVDL